MAGLIIESRSVAWYPVHEFVLPILDEVRTWPLAGSVTWQQLPDSHPAKIAAVLDGGQHWALRLEACQTALAEASQDISQCTDWPAVARSIRRHRAAYIPRRKASLD